MLSGASFSITTFGCQMNKHDSERVSGMLQELGMHQVDTIPEADVVVFMTCCVREKADERLMGQVASMKNIPVRAGSRFGKRYVCIGGCIGQRDGKGLLESLPHVDLVFGTHNLDELPHFLQEVVEDQTRQASIIEGRTEFHDLLPESREQAWAAWLPITVGCNNFCTYCVVPSVRGREISRPFEEIEVQASRYVADGVKEITLLGQNVNSYGRDLYGKPRFDDVLDVVSASGVERIRFATSHPKDLSDSVIARFASLDNLMPALHLPVQSGSDRILEVMNRRYTAKHYLSLIEKLRQARPDIALSTDIIVGFPGETEEDFQRTCDIVREVGYTQVFTFIYSKRAGTPAAEMVDDTPREVIQNRFDRLRAIVEEGALSANKSYEGTLAKVLFEGGAKKGSGVAMGKSEHGLTVHVQMDNDEAVQALAGKIIPVHIDESKTWYLRGSLIS